MSLKKTIGSLFFAAASVIALVAAGCTGPQGPEGPAGADGTNGKDGLSDTVYVKDSMYVYDSVFAVVKCSQCHNNNQLIVAKQRQWEMSKHGELETSFDEEGNRSSCMPCHNGAVYPLWVNGNKDTAAFRTLGLYDNYTSANCRTCHNIHVKFDTTDYALTKTTPVTLLAGGATSDMGKGNLCSECHQARKDNYPAQIAAAAGDSFAITTRMGPHHAPHANMIQGLTGYEDSTKVSGTHALLVKDGCVQCHASVESFKNHTFKPVAATCNAAACHGTGPIPVVMTTTEILKDSCSAGVFYDTLTMDSDSSRYRLLQLSHELRDSLVARGAGTVSATGLGRFSVKAVKAPKTIAGAAYNLVYFNEDKSSGAHNNKYASYLIVRSLQNLGVTRDLTAFYKP